MRGLRLSLSPPQLLVFTMILMVVSTLLMISIAVIVYGIFNGYSIKELSQLLMLDMKGGNIGIMKFMQSMQSIGLFIIPPLLVAYFVSSDSPNWLFINRGFTFRAFILVLFLSVLSNPLVSYMTSINQSLQFPEWLSEVEQWMKEKELYAQQVTRLILEMNNYNQLLINLVVVAVIPALGEELLFRGVVQRVFTLWTLNVHWGIWSTAALFSFMHFQFYGFFPRMFLGVMFGYLLLWSGSLWIPIIAHFVNNASAVLMYYFMGEGIADLDMTNGIERNAHLGFSAMLSAIFVFVVLRSFYITQQKRRLSLLDYKE